MFFSGRLGGLGIIVGLNHDDPRVVIPDTVQAGAASVTIVGRAGGAMDAEVVHVTRDVVVVSGEAST